MDIAGAKALKERLGEKAAEAVAPTVPAEVSEGVPPVYRWTGVNDSSPAPSEDVEDSGQTAAASVALFRRLVPSFR
jgi:hypothetical protein